MQAYYKTNAPQVMSVIAEYHAQIEFVRNAGKAFAAAFGGDLVVSETLKGYEVSGLAFKPKKESKLWTKPDARNAMMQRPRASLPKMTPQEMGELAALQTKWATLLPAAKACFAPVMTAMGTSWSNCMFSGFAMFVHDGYAYVCASGKLESCMQEILASEYASANAQAEKEDA